MEVLFGDCLGSPDACPYPRRANIASIVGSEDACEGLAAALAGVDGVAVAEELLPYVVRAVVLQPYASAKLVSRSVPSHVATAAGSAAILVWCIPVLYSPILPACSAAHSALSCCDRCRVGSYPCVVHSRPIRSRPAGLQCCACYMYKRRTLCLCVSSGAHCWR